MSEWEFSYLAGLVNAKNAQFIGAGWYSPRLFGNVWMEEMGLDPEKSKEDSSKKPFILSFLSSLVLAVALSFLIGWSDHLSFGGGIWMGLVVGIGVGAMAMAPQYAFSQRSLKLYLIDSGHNLAVMVVMCALLGPWL